MTSSSLRRNLRLLLLLPTVALLVAGCGSGGDSSDDASASSANTPAGAPDLSKVTLRVADIQSSTQPAFEASGQAKGTPYSIKWIPFQNGAPAYQALAAGKIDLVGAGDTSAVFAQAAGTPIKVVAASRSADPKKSSQAILVPKDSSIASLGDLKGKKIGYFESTPTHYLLLKALDKAGLTLDDVTAVNLPFPQGISALDSGKIDALSTMGPFIPIAEKTTGAKVLVNGAGLSDTQSYVSARAKALDDPATSAAIGDYVKRTAAARLWSNAHPEESAKISAKVTKSPYAIQLAVAQLAPIVFYPIDEQAIAIHQAQTDRFAEAGVLKNKLSAKPLFVTTFNRQLPAP